MYIEDFVPLEYKHYNSSRVLNLPTYIEAQYPTNLYYDKLLEVESEEYTFDVFKGILMSVLKSWRDDRKDDFAKFIFNKYRVEYDSQSIGLNRDRTEKIYKLKYKFYLK